MKTIKKILVLVMMLTIATGYANENDINVSTKTITNLKFSDVKVGHQYVIKDHKGSIIYSETIKRNGSFLKEFDFKGLDDGYYTFEISKDFEILIQPFKMASQKASFNKDLITKEFKPVVRVDNNILMVSQLSLNSIPLQVELIYDGEVIHSDKLQGGQILKAKYGLSNHEKGTYYLRFKSGDRSFFESFKL